MVIISPESKSPEPRSWQEDPLKKQIENLVYDRAGAPIWAQRTMRRDKN